MTDLPRCAKNPCSSCPYRKDVPSGVWDAEEYIKLLDYDGSTGEQAAKGAFALFMCHQRNGALCAGWVACHDTDHLLALRLHPVDKSVYNYHTDVPVFETGHAACGHGLVDQHCPSDEALAVQATITKLKGKRP